MLLVGCKYEIRNNKTKNLINDDLNLSFSDDNEFDDEFDDESMINLMIILMTNLMMNLLMKKMPKDWIKSVNKF